MSLAAKAAEVSRRLGTRHPAAVARDLAALIGAAMAIGLALGAGLLLTVYLFV
jgi:hypothetical protein